MKRTDVNLRMLMVAAPAIVALLVVSRVTQRPARWDSGYRPVMGTFSRIVVTAPKGRIARQSAYLAYKDQQAIDELMSTYQPYSELSRVNAEAAHGPVHVSVETMTVLQRAVEISRLTEGAFDVTVGPLLDLWKHAADVNRLPTEEELAAARQRVGWQFLRLDPNALTVQFLREGMRLDLGGIAKGYAIDRSIDLIRRAGATGAMVDIGGDIRCFGRPPHGHPDWRIALQDPNVAPDDLAPNKILTLLHLHDQAVATSGHYRRFSRIQGQTVSHIVTPRDGSGHHVAASTTVIAPDAMTADALATALSVLGPERGLALVDRLEGVEALIVLETPAGPLFRMSSGMGAYLDHDPNEPLPPAHE